MVRRGTLQRVCSVAVLALASVALVRCNTLLDLHSINVVEPDDADTVPVTDAAVDASDASADLTYVFGGGVCQTCLAGSCASQEAACAGDPACNARVRCISCCADPKCSGTPYFSPACYDKCAVENVENDKSSSLELGFFTCASDSCRSACQMGSDFACVGRYKWPSVLDPTTSRIRVGFEIINNETQAPVTAGSIVACESKQWPCQTSGGVPLVDSGATVAVSSRNQFNGPQAWKGYYGILSPEIVPAIFVRSRPEYRDRPKDPAGQKERVPLITPNQLNLAYAGTGVVQIADAGTLAGAVEDCRTILGIFAEGARISIDEYPTLPVIYVTPEMLPSMTLTSTSPAGQFFIQNVPPGKAHVRITRDRADGGTGADGGDGGVVIAVVEIEIQAGTVTTLGALPDTSP